ncbi:MAG: hypothetical protein RIK87_05880 [Fuerstiella sp.]
MIEGSRSRVLSGKDVRVSAAPVRVGGRTIHHDHQDAESGPATLREVRDADGNITEIHLRCGCGTTTVVLCEYLH